MEFEADKKNQKVPKVVANLVDKTGVPYKRSLKALLENEFSSFAYKLQKLVWKAAKEFDKDLKIQDVHIEHPANPDYGDYATNIGLVLAKRLKAKPFDLASKITAELTVCRPDFIEKVEAVPPGFVNFWLSQEFLLNSLVQSIKLGEKYGSNQLLKGKKILLEHTSPNPQTTIMIGHLRNNFLGMFVSRMLGFLGARVIKDCLVNDRGVHVCRSMWGYLVFGCINNELNNKGILNYRNFSDEEITNAIRDVDWRYLLEIWSTEKNDWWTPTGLKQKPDHANLIWYVLGSRAYSLSEEAKKQVGELLVAWEAEDQKVRTLWKTILDWSAEGYKETYKRIGSSHEHVWYESNHYKLGKDIVKSGLEKGVFKKSQGAIVSNLSQYSLPDTILTKSDGTALYHTQDLALVKLKMDKYPSDLYVWDIGSEQTLYFKQLFAMAEQLSLGRLADFYHLSYELVNLKGGGKMSTRKGNVIPADDLLDELRQKALTIMENSNQDLRGNLSEQEKEKIAETVGLAAAKYGMLKFSRETTIYFDIDESLSLEGNSGPYLQYTYARARSVLRKARISSTSQESLRATSEVNINSEELAILRTIYQFPELILAAAKSFAPNLVCNFLFDLAQKYNNFYNLHPIIKAPSEELVNLRLALTLATAQVLKNGLLLLGIEPLEKM